MNLDNVGNSVRESVRRSVNTPLYKYVYEQWGNRFYSSASAYELALKTINRVQYFVEDSIERPINSAAGFLHFDIEIELHRRKKKLMNLENVNDITRDFASSSFWKMRRYVRSSVHNRIRTLIEDRISIVPHTVRRAEFISYTHPVKTSVWNTIIIMFKKLLFQKR